jgi:hypothetical protein
VNVRVLAATALVACALAACTSNGGTGAAPSPTVSPTGSPASAAPSGPPALDPGTAARILKALPAPVSTTDFFAAPLFTGSSSLGDLGSASWNIHQRGSARLWAAKLYIYRTAVDASRALQHSPAAAAICASRATAVSGFGSAGATTVAVSCKGKGSPSLAWAIVGQTVGKIHAVLATNAATSSSAVAAARPVLRALTPVIARAQLAVKDLKASP